MLCKLNGQTHSGLYYLLTFRSYDIYFYIFSYSASARYTFNYIMFRYIGQSCTYRSIFSKNILYSKTNQKRTHITSKRFLAHQVHRWTSAQIFSFNNILMSLRGLKLNTMIPCSIVILELFDVSR